MRTLIMVIITLVIVAGFAAPLNAQVPNVELYFDEGLLFASADCPPGPPGTVLDHLYVVANNFNMMMSAIEYRIEYPAILFFAIDNVIDFDASITGSSPDGISITFSTPQDAFGQYVIQLAWFVWMCDGCGLGNWDVPVRVRPHPSSGKILAVRWPDLEAVEAIGRKAWICFTGVPVHETTWGEIKALYK